MDNKCDLYPVSPLNTPFNISIICDVLCRSISSQKYKTPFDYSNSTSSPLSLPQYSMTTNTTRSSIYFLCYSYFILPQYSSNSSSTTCSATPDKPKLFIVMLPVRFSFPLENLSKHALLLEVVFNTTFLSVLSRLAKPSPSIPALQISLFSD